jgi:hypothetical protein
MFFANLRTQPHWTPPSSLSPKLPRRPDASPSQESHETVDIGTIILRKANLVLDRLISAGQSTRGIKVNKYITWGNRNVNYEPRLTEQREQITSERISLVDLQHDYYGQHIRSTMNPLHGIQNIPLLM